MKLPAIVQIHTQLLNIANCNSRFVLAMFLPFRGNPLNIRNDFSAFSVRPFDASQVGVSGIGINKINATMQIAQLTALTKRQFDCNQTKNK